MENPLTEEQIEKLNEIVSLPEDQQKIELGEFLKILNQEQIEFLKKQQQPQGCPFCFIAEGKIPAKKIYEDNIVIAVLDINPANKGHTILIPKKHNPNLESIDDEDLSHIFLIASKIGNEIIKNLKADGVNIFLANGAVAGQNLEHIAVHVIPRYKGDNINLVWKGNKLSDNEMNEIQNKLKDKIKTEEKIVKEEIKFVNFDEEERIP